METESRHSTELRSLSGSVAPSSRDTTSHNSDNVEIEQPSLPPADRGKDAWLMLASCCVIQLPVWGMSYWICFAVEWMLTR